MNTAPKLHETLQAAAKRLRLGVEGPRIADELDAIATALAPPGGEGVDDVCEMRICEVPHIMLRRDRLYRFTVDPNCAGCRAAAMAYDPAPPTTPQSAPEDGVALSWLDDVLARMKGQLRSSDAAFDWKIVRDYHADLCRVRNNLTTPPPASQERGDLSEDDVEWIVNDLAELGVKIGNQFFFLYKGNSLVYEDAKHDDGSPMHWRTVGKREFGECCHPINHQDYSKHGTVSLSDSDRWQLLPASPPSSAAEGPKVCEESEHAWHPDADVPGVSYCVKCDVTRRMAASSAAEPTYQDLIDHVTGAAEQPNSTAEEVLMTEREIREANADGAGIELITEAGRAAEQAKPVSIQEMFDAEQAQAGEDEQK